MNASSGRWQRPEIELDARWLIAVRIVLLGTALLSVAVKSVVSDYSFATTVWAVSVPAGLLFLFSAASALWLRSHSPTKAFNSVQLGVDVLTVSGVVYLTGGPISPFLFLYLPLVMLASTLFSRTTALAVATLSIAVYSAMVLAMLGGVLPALDGGPVEVPNGGALFQILGLFSAMSLIAVATSFLREKLSSSREQVAESQRVLEEVSIKARSIEEQLAVQERMARLLAEERRPESGSNAAPHGLIGETPVMKKIFELISRVAESDAAVLISGESGTGKELAARAIHRGSARSNKPFVAVNCGAIPENLIESELFGHKKGSFTGADSDTLGLFREADGGTLFLDEIGELPLAMQSKLLRAIQERCVRPVGSSRDIPVNVRIVSATNRNLKHESQGGRFREDLFYRLNVINVKLPPLRDRIDDIPLLVNTMLKKLVTSGRTPVVPPATMQLLMRYAYPGNVRELENILERALVLGGDVVLPEHLHESVRSPVQRTARGETEIIVDESITFPCELERILEAIERRYLEQALVHTNGKKKRAAAALGLNFRSFRYRLAKFGIAEQAEGEAE